MESSTLGAIGIALLVFVGVIVLKFQNRSDTSNDAQAAIMARVKTLPNYEPYPRLPGWADQAHSTAFNAAYEMGGRRQSSKFDEDKCIDTFLRNLASIAERERQAERALNVRRQHAKIAYERGKDYKP